MKKFESKFRVYYEDTDAGGIVYHANYLKFLERCRTDWVRSFGVSQQNLLEQSVAFVVKDMQLSFNASAVLDDELTVSCQLVKLGRASLILAQHIYNVTDQKQVHPIVEANVKIGCVNTQHKRPSVIPDFIQREMRSES